MGFQIRAGTVGQITPCSGEWLFVDVGFASRKPTCGVLTSTETAMEVTFSECVDRVVRETRKNCSKPLNLMLEAPLSVAFRQNGNPTGRACEHLNGKHRYWYEQPAAPLIIATGHLLRSLVDAGIQREVRLFEGFVSFKPKGVKSSHTADVITLKNVVWHLTPARIYALDDLKRDVTDRLESAFAFAHMDFGIPPVVLPQTGIC